MIRDPRKPLLASMVAAFVVTACGQIVGLHDPDDVAATGGDDGGAPIATEAGADDVEITPPSVDIGTVTCGAAPAAPKSIVIKNKGTTTPKYSVELPSESGFEIAGALTGDLAPGAEVTVTLTPKPAASGDLAADVVVTAGSVTSTIHVTAKAEGGHIAFAPTSANLGDVRKQNGGMLDVAMTNSGNEPITLTRVDSSVPAAFSATWEGAPAPLAIDPGATKIVTVKLAAGEEAAVNAVLTPVIEGAHCGAVPTLPVEGKLVNQDVTLSTADFGKQFCTTAPTLQREIVISNYTTLPLAYAATLKNGAASAFNIVSGANDNIAAGSTAAPMTKSITLSMKPLGTALAPINEIVDVEISGIGAPSGGARTANALADIRGVVFTLNTNNSTGFRYNDTRYFTMSNTGNEPFSPTTVFVRDANTTQQAAWGSNFLGTILNPGASRQPYVNFKPQYYGNYAGTWTFTNTNGIPMCNGAQKLHVQGAVYY